MLVSINDWRGGTEAMPSKFRGPYFDLLTVLFDHGGDLLFKPDVICRAARIDRRAFEKFWACVGPKFIVADNTIRHHRVDEQLLKYSKTVAKLRQNGSKGGKKTQQKQRARQANAQANQTNGLVNPSKEGSLPNLPQDGAIAWEALRAACGDSGHLSLEMDKLESAIVDFAEGVFYVKDGWSANAFSERLGPQLRAIKAKLKKLPEDPTQIRRHPDLFTGVEPLRSINGGKA